MEQQLCLELFNNNVNEKIVVQSNLQGDNSWVQLAITYPYDLVDLKKLLRFRRKEKSSDDRILDASFWYNKEYRGIKMQLFFKEGTEGEIKNTFSEQRFKTIKNRESLQTLPFLLGDGRNDLWTETIALDLYKKLSISPGDIFVPFEEEEEERKVHALITGNVTLAELKPLLEDNSIKNIFISTDKKFSNGVLIKVVSNLTKEVIPPPSKRFKGMKILAVPPSC